MNNSTVKFVSTFILLASVKPGMCVRNCVISDRLPEAAGPDVAPSCVVGWTWFSLIKF